MTSHKANNVKQIREKLLMSKAELARKAGLSPLTIDRVEQGMNCRMETKRKIILALGMKLVEKDKVFLDDELEEAVLKRKEAIKEKLAEKVEERESAEFDKVEVIADSTERNESR